MRSWHKTQQLHFSLNDRHQNKLKNKDKKRESIRSVHCQINFSQERCGSIGPVWKTAGAVFQNTYLFLYRCVHQIKQFLHYVKTWITFLLCCFCVLKIIVFLNRTSEGFHNTAPRHSSAQQPTTAAENEHCTFFSGENLRGSTMYKSSGPTKEGREGGQVKGMIWQLWTCTGMTLLASSRTWDMTND